MTTDELTAALHACAAGIYPLEAGVALLTAEGTFLRRSDFTGRFIERGTGSGTAMAVIDWDAVITALQAGKLPCSGRERRVLTLFASFAAASRSTSGTPQPASMTATSKGWSARSGMHPASGQNPGDIDYGS